LRLAQAIGVGAQVLATSCPYCITNFEDSRLNTKGGDAIEVKDITEIIRDAL
jgi:Fe-S oxidoreductase